MSTKSSIRRQAKKDAVGLSEADATSLNELIKFEPTERPPNLAELAEFTHHRFSQKWIKYIYAKFKNECPSGRMHLVEFKQLFAAYMPNRVSDAYFERMFNAFLHVSPYSDQLSFKDLIVCLALLQETDARTNAEWTMKLINGKDSDRVDFDEFKEFVESVYLLTGADPLRRVDSTILAGPPPPIQTQLHVDGRSQIDVNNRVSAIFKEMDIQQRGYLTIQDLEQLFHSKESKLL